MFSFSVIFNTLIYEPLFNGLIFLINNIPFHDAGVAVVLLTIFVKIVLFPFSHHSIKTQGKIRKIEPIIRNIKEEFKNNRQKQAEKIMELYKEHGISVYSGFLTLLIQLPILFALYKLFWNSLSFDYGLLYDFINTPSFVQIKFLNLIDITKKSYFLAFLAGVSQYFQIKLAEMKIKKNNFSNKNIKNNPDSFNDLFAKQIKYAMPIFILLISLSLPSAVSLYWTTMNIFAIVHESIVKKKAEKINLTAND